MKIFSLLIELALLSGCASWVEQPDTLGGGRSPLMLKAWHMDGRIGVQSEQEAWQANLDWDHLAEQDRLRLSGPLSQGMVSIIVQDDLIYINEGNGVSELSRDPDEMLRSRIGFAVPLASLRFWIMGQPDPDRPYGKIPGTEEGSPGFTQSGWRIRPEKLIRIDGMPFPSKLRVEGFGVKLKILADQWEIEK